MTTTFKPEVVFYYAEAPTDKVSPKGNIIYTTHLFESLKEAQKSGTDYHIATLADINDLADVGVFIHDKIVVTPQGKFELVIITGEDVDGSEIENGCVYRYVGAPVKLSEAVEYHLFWNKGSELIFVTNANGMYTAHIQNVDGQIVSIQYAGVVEESQMETTENIELAKYALVLTIPSELIGVSVGKTYPILTNEFDGDMYVIDDLGRENSGALMMCQTMLFM